jgi:PAS domain S-box-containing protein
LASPVIVTTSSPRLAAWQGRSGILCEQARSNTRDTERSLQNEPPNRDPARAPSDAARPDDPLWRALFDTALDCIISMDHTGRVLDLNRAAEDTFGWPRDGAIGRELAELIIPHRLRAAHHAGLRRYLESGEGPVLGSRIEVPALHAEGHEFPVELAISRLPTAGPPVFVAYLRDISTRVRLERLRSLRAEAMQAIARADSVDAAADGVLHAFCSLLGWELGFAWQRDAHDLRCANTYEATPGAKPGFVEASRSIRLPRGKGLPGMAWENRAAVWRSDVTIAENFPRAPMAQLDDVHAGVACPVMVGSEVIGAIEFYSEHIHEPDADLVETLTIVSAQLGQAWQRQRTENALRKSEAQLRLLANTIPQLAWMAAADGTVFWYNQRWYDYTGTTPETMQSEGWRAVHHPDELPWVDAKWESSMRDGVPFEMVFPLRAADGSFRPFLTRVEPLRDEDDERILYWFGTNTDISNIRHMEDSLREADRRKDEFLAMLAHELRNPLAPISTALRILELPKASASIQADARQIIGRQVEHLVRLVDDLLDVSRFIGGKVTLQREITELARVVSRAVEIALPSLKARNHDFDVRLPSTPVVLDVDEVRITQAIGNLLTNAARYTPPGGRVVLEARTTADTVEVGVRDTGIGIEASMLDKVFYLFVQAGHLDAGTHGGLGIGLTLARQLVRLHGGEITVRSAGPGRGSTFLLTLPRTARPAAETSPEVDAPPVRAIDVLVVDDNRDAARSLSMLLELLNHNVRSCHDGASALAAVAERRPQLILLDLGMPGMDGFEVVRRLRASPGAPLVIVALSGWGQQSDRDRTTEAGFDHHLVKPVSADELDHLLQDVAAGRFTR